MIIISSFISTSFQQQACTTNAFRTIYLDASFQVPNSADTTYSKYNTRLASSAFTLLEPDANNWCTNNTDIFATKPTKVCCTTDSLNTIAWQFASKWVNGATSVYASAFGNAYNNKTVTDNCVVKTVDSATIAKLTQVFNNSDINRSLWGIYYAVYKMVVAYMPYGQLLSCLICATDASVSALYTSSTLKIDKTAYDAMLTAMGQAFYDFQTNFNNILTAYVDVVTKYLIDTTKSSATCTSTLKSALKFYTFCSTASECTTKSQTVFEANTGLQFEKVGAAYTLKARRELAGSRMLATSPVTSGGVGVSKHTAITGSIKVNGADSKTLAAAWNSMLLSAIALLLAILMI